MDKFNAFGEKLMVGGAEVGRKMSAGMSSVGGKVKELLQVQTQADKIVEEATNENMQEPDWACNLRICDMVNGGKLSGQEVVRAIKKRVAVKRAAVQYLALILLETCAMNCEKMFSEVASEKVLDEMVKVIDDPNAIISNRHKALQLIQAWGESSEELSYLPVFEETYKSLKSRGIRFPGQDNENVDPLLTTTTSVTSPRSTTTAVGYPNPILGQQEGHRELFIPQSNLSQEQMKEVFDVARNSIELLSTVLTSSPHQEAVKDDLTTMLAEQCRQSQVAVQRLVQSVGDNEPLLFEALNVNDEIQFVLSKYEEMQKAPTSQSPQLSEPASIPVDGEEDDSSQVGQEDALIRNRFSKPSNAHPTPDEDAALSDLDEMIFGKKGGTLGEQDSQKHKHDDVDSL